MPFTKPDQVAHTIQHERQLITLPVVILGLNVGLYCMCLRWNHETLGKCHPSVSEKQNENSHRFGPSRFSSVARSSAFRLKGPGLILTKGTWPDCGLNPQ